MGQDIYGWPRHLILNDKSSNDTKIMNISKTFGSVMAAAAFLLAAGCNDQLDLLPNDRISEAEYFRTEADLMLFSNPFYNDILPKTQFKNQSDIYICQALSDEMKGGSYRTVPSTGGGWTWTNLRRINTLLGNIDKCEDEAARVKYSAVARFFRAYFYSSMVARFGDVPWYDRELSSTDEGLYAPRDSRESIMRKILEDVDYAIDNLPSKSQESEAPFRATKGAALALKSRFCLYEGTFRKYHGFSLEGHDWRQYLRLAADAAKKLIDSGEYALFSTGHPETDYNTLFAQDDSDKGEYILSISYRYAIFNNSHDSNAHMLLPNQGRPGYTRKLICSYLNSDGTRFTDREGWQTMPFTEETKDRDPRLAQSIRTPGYHRIGREEILAPDYGVTITGYQPIKFVQDPTAAGGNTDRASYSICDMPVFRYAEVLLNYAEALAELGEITQNDLDISVNLLRDRVGMSHMNLVSANSDPDPYLMSKTTGYPNVEGKDKGIVLEIRRERTVELVQEGFRWNDLVRWKCGDAINDHPEDRYSPLTGVYFPSIGEYDLSGDGKTDFVIYSSGDAKPADKIGVQTYELGKEIYLTEGDHGYVYFHHSVPRIGFDEGRDYLYPIPIHERSLNPNLTQNPGWNDGLGR